MHDHVGYASLVGALALLAHALRALLPDLVKAVVRLVDAVRDALKARAEAARLDAETRARVEVERELAAQDVRDHRDRCERELALVHGQLDALRAEFDSFRRQVTAGHTRPL